MSDSGTISFGVAGWLDRCDIHFFDSSDLSWFKLFGYTYDDVLVEGVFARADDAENEKPLASFHYDNKKKVKLIGLHLPLPRERIEHIHSMLARNQNDLGRIEVDVSYEKKVRTGARSDTQEFDVIEVIASLTAGPYFDSER